MVSSGDLRDDTAILFEDINLGNNNIAQNGLTVFYDRGGSFVARSFNSQDIHDVYYTTGGDGGKGWAGACGTGGCSIGGVCSIGVGFMIRSGSRVGTGAGSGVRIGADSETGAG